MFKSLGNTSIVRGLLALVVGIVALAWPDVTVLTLVIIFAAYAFMDAITHFALGFSSSAAKPVFRHLLLGLVDVAAGVTALVWPGATALVLVLLVGSWAVVTGAIQLAAGFHRGETAGARAMIVAGGLASIAFGIILFARPDVGALTIALLFGLFNVMVGTWNLVNGIQLRNADKTLHALSEPVKTRVAV